MTSSPTNELVQQLIAADCIKYGEFILKSGAFSNYYIDLRESTDHSELFASIVKILADKISQLYDSSENIAIVGVPYGVVPIAGAVANRLGCTYHAVRKEVKAYGRETNKFVSDTRRFIIIEDVMSTGSSIEDTIRKLEGKNVSDVVVIANREAGGKENLARSFPTVKLHSILNLADLLDARKSS